MNKDHKLYKIRLGVNETLKVNIVQRNRKMDLMDGKKIYVLIADRIVNENDETIGSYIYRSRCMVIHLRRKGRELFETNKIFRDKYYRCLIALKELLPYEQKLEINKLINGKCKISF